MYLVAKDVSISFGSLQAVRDMTIEVGPKEIVGLIGPNGAGKTTFINCIAGAYQPGLGSINWRGESLLGLPPHRIISRGVVRTFQNVASLHDLTVLDIVKLGASMVRRDGSAAARFRSERAREEYLLAEILEPLHLVDVARQPLQTLSYGLRKAVDLARALACEPQLLLLDEPVAGLTAQEGMRMADVIRTARDRHGCAVMMVEHKMDVVNAVCERIAVMASGAKIFEGTPAEVQSDPEVRRVYLGEP